MDSNFRFFTDSRDPAGDADGAALGSTASVPGLAGVEVGMTAAGVFVGILDGADIDEIGVEVAVTTGVGCCATAFANKPKKQT
ncbi:MAG TPA: hypothetical protein VEH26_02585 [Chthoniobacterales bacterium]|nr:hypothetical protein [Chthoniobacterales bacterium]